MDATERNPHPALIARLLSEPGAFEFFRAVQVLEARAGTQNGAPRAIGADRLFSEVGVRFGAAPSLAFPGRPISSVTEVERDGSAPFFDVSVSFLGLVGPGGTLPTHYAEAVLQRLHAKDAALRDFLDAFQDRSIALFYRAWKKYRLPVAYLATRRSAGEPDPVLTALLGLVGSLPRPHGKPIGAGELAQVHHAGLFASQRRSANALRGMLRGLLGCPVQVEQFVGQWVALDAGARSRLGSGPGPGLPARLGEESVLGARVWCVDARIRVVAGPLDRARFRELWPGGERVRFLWELLRTFLGPLIECDLVWELAPDAPAAARLGGDQRLGRDCWLGWSEFGRPDTRVPSPPWHNPRPGTLRPGSPPEPAASGASRPAP